MSFSLIQKHSPKHWELMVTSAHGEEKNLHLYQGLAVLAECTYQAVLIRFEFGTVPKLQAKLQEPPPSGHLRVMIDFTQVEEDVVKRFMEQVSKDKAVALHTLLALPLILTPGYTAIQDWLRSRPRPTWKKAELLRFAQRNPNIMRDLCFSATKEMKPEQQAEKELEISSNSDDRLIAITQELTQRQNLYWVRTYTGTWSTKLLTVSLPEADLLHAELTREKVVSQLIVLKARHQNSRRWRITSTSSVIYFRCELSGGYGMLDPSTFKARERFFQKLDTNFYNAVYSSSPGTIWPAIYDEFVNLMCEEKIVKWGGEWTLTTASDNPRQHSTRLQIKNSKEALAFVATDNRCYKLPVQGLDHGLAEAVISAGYFEAVENSSQVRLIDPELRIELG